MVPNRLKLKLNASINPYILIGVCFFFVYLFIDPTIDGFILHSYRILSVVFIYSLAIWGFYLYKKGKLDADLVVLLLIVAGTVIRLVYVMYTPWHTRQHDVLDYDSDGHMGYITYIAERLSLPDSNYYQFSQPPLHYIISGLFQAVNQFFKVPRERIIEGFQLITAFFSSCTMVVCHRIFKRMRLHGFFLVIAMSIVCLHPTFFILAGSINNDMIMIFFTFSTILWLLKWYENPGFYNICFLAVSLGLAMMSKASAAILAFVIAPIFLIKLFSYEKPRKRWKFFIQYIAFGAVSIPIGMWHPIRNLIRFNQPFGFVHPIDVSNPLFCGDKSIIQRFVSIPVSQLVARLYCLPSEDYNIPICLIKSSVFGEYDYNKDVNSFAVGLMVFNALLILLSLIAMVYVMMDRRPENRLPKITLFLLWVVQMGAFVYFNVKYPFGCSMDFRYIVPTLLCGAGFIGIACERLSLERKPLWKRLKQPVLFLVGGFCLFSSVFYLFI